MTITQNKHAPSNGLRVKADLRITLLRDEEYRHVPDFELCYSASKILRQLITDRAVAIAVLKSKKEASAQLPHAENEHAR